LSREEDEQVHQELRELIASESDFLSAARQANKIGRRLLALKLATAAVVYGPTARREPARAFRVWLLAAIGETKAAHDDATAWVQSHPSPTQLAWGSLGQQCETLKLFGEAIEAYGKALAVDSSQHLIRCRRAQLLLNQSRDGQALAELKMVFDGSPTGKAPDAILPICVNLLDRLETHNNLDSAATLLGWVGPQVQGSAPLLGHAARVNALAGREKEARKQLKKARSMTPDLPIYKRVEALLGEPSSWRKW